MKLNGEVKHRS